MTPLEAARRLRPAQDASENCYECGHYGDSDDPHATDCPWLALPQLVAALEMVAPMMAAVKRMGRHHGPSEPRAMGPYAPPDGPQTYVTCDHYCISWPCSEAEAYEAVSAFVAALKGTADA